MRRQRLLIFLTGLALLVMAAGLFSAAGPKIRLVVATHYGGGQKEPLEAYFAEYMKLHPEVEIVHQTVPFDDYLKKVQTSHLSGDAPDIYHIYSLWGPSLVRARILHAPPSSITKDVSQNYVKAAVEGVKIDGKIYGIPTEIDNYAIVYNKRLLREAGYTSPPKTWTELIQMAKKITKIDANGKMIQAGFAFMRGWDSAVVHPFMSLLYANGGRMFNKNFTKAEFNSAAGVAALELEVRLFKEKCTDANASVWSFPTGTIGFMFMAPWYENGLRDALKDKYESEVGVCPIPPGDKGYANTMYTWMYAVDNSSKVKTEAWKFLQWLNGKREGGNTSREGDFLVGQGIIPGRQIDIDNHPQELNDFFTKTFIDQLKYAVPEPNVLQGAEIKTILMQEIEQAWAGAKTPKQALDDAARKVNNILAEFY